MYEQADTTTTSNDNFGSERFFRSSPSRRIAGVARRAVRSAAIGVLMTGCFAAPAFAERANVATPSAASAEQLDLLRLQVSVLNVRAATEQAWARAAALRAHADLKRQQANRSALFAAALQAEALKTKADLTSPASRIDASTHLLSRTAQASPPA